MAQNFVQEGEHLLLTNGTGSAIASGAPVFDGKLVGIALGTIANGAQGQVATQGVFSLAKKSALVVAEGDVLFWDATPGEITKTAADGLFIGYAAAAAAGADTHVNVLLVQTKQGENVAAITTADGSDAATTQALANATKTKVNDLIAKLVAAGIIAGA